MTTEEVLNLIELVLDNNNFQFEDSHYLQIDGTAIGSKLGKNYDRSKAVFLLWFLIVTCFCCPYLYFGSAIMLVTYFSKF